MESESKYQPYGDYDIHLMFSEPREISGNPYMLHAAFMLGCLFEAYTPDEGDCADDEPKLEENWGWEIPRQILDGIVKNANEQFVYALDNSTQIDVWGAGFSIRKANQCDRSRLHEIFNFPMNGDNYVVTKTGVMNLQETSCAKEQVRGEFSDNMSYLRKVIFTAEDDDNDGWYKLTDMEVTMYLWALYYRKNRENDNEAFRRKFKNDVPTTRRDEMSCWNALAQSESRPHGMFTFSASKVREWNAKHGQESVIDSIDAKVADDYWYEKALKSSWK